MGSWKWLRKASTNYWKDPYVPLGSSIYHCDAISIRVHWNNHNLIESWFKEFDEHQRWKVVTWSPRSSPFLPSNFGMSDGSLVGTRDHVGSWITRSFINLDKYARLSMAIKGRQGCDIWPHAPTKYCALRTALCWPLTKFWEILGHVDLFWDFDILAKEECKTKWRSWDLGPLLGPFFVFGNM
jgi:hypothetical protein